MRRENLLGLNCHIISPSEGGLILLYIGRIDMKIHDQIHQEMMRLIVNRSLGLMKSDPFESCWKMMMKI